MPGDHQTLSLLHQCLPYYTVGPNLQDNQGRFDPRSDARWFLSRLLVDNASPRTTNRGNVDLRYNLDLAGCLSKQAFRSLPATVSTRSLNTCTRGIGISRTYLDGPNYHHTLRLPGASAVSIKDVWLPTSFGCFPPAFFPVMALSPPLTHTRSPSSSVTYCSSGRSSLDYPSPPVLVDQQYALSSLYAAEQRCSMTPPMDSQSSLPSFDELCQPEWTESTLLHSSSSGSVMPNILSSGYDSYQGYEQAPAPPYGHDIYEAHHSRSPNINASNPLPSGSISRPAGSSSRSAVSYTSATPVSEPLLSRVKLEHARDHGEGLEASHYPSPGSIHTTYATDSASYAGSTSGYVSDGQSSWRTSDYQPGIDPYYEGTAHNSHFVQDGRRSYRVERPRRAPRRLTTREEANFQCEVKGCGKLFSRSYNFKAHMETHDEKREYPFPCPADDCNKKFVRKTDLQRHHQSVHMKERNHRCDYCGRMFARKDTLRRSVCSS